MKYTIALLVLLFPLIALSKSQIDSVRFLHAKKAPHTTDLIQLVEYLEKGAKDDKQKVETFFYWIAQNIEYGVELMKKGDRTWADVSVDSTLLKKKTICAGYSLLLSEMCWLAEIEALAIQGTVSNFEDNKIESARHAWNVVKINNKWELIDATWASGEVERDNLKFHKRIDLRYLIGDPNFFIVDHFPDDEQWQLLLKPITIDQFKSEEWNKKRKLKWMR